MTRETIVIVPAIASDAAEIIALQHLAFQSEAKLVNNPNIPPLRETVEDTLTSHAHGIILKAVRDCRIIASVRCRVENDTAHVGKLMTHPDCRGKGLGTQLLLTIESYGGKQRLELFTSALSEKNIALYQRCGYAVFRDQVAKSGLRMVYMEKHLPAAPLVQCYPEPLPLDEFLTPDEFINADHQAVIACADTLFRTCATPEQKIKAAFTYVRDQIHHAADIASERVTKSASGTLQQGHGICMAKSHLLTALLRCAKIPAGLCYQRLSRHDRPGSGYELHGLNAVFVQGKNTWIRLDARGGERGRHIDCSLEHDCLVYPERPELGELSYRTIYAHPHPAVAAAFKQYNNRTTVDFGIDEIDESVELSK